MTTINKEKVREQFGTREGTNLEKVIFALIARVNKPVLLTEVARIVYKKGDRANCLKVKAVTVGLNMTIDAYELPYAHVVFEGRGEEATVMLASKARARAIAKKSPKAKAVA
jgi:hypothetical protein